MKKQIYLQNLKDFGLNSDPTGRCHAEFQPFGLEMDVQIRYKNHEYGNKYLVINVIHQLQICISL